MLFYRLTSCTTMIIGTCLLILFLRPTNSLLTTKVFQSTPFSSLIKSRTSTSAPSITITTRLYNSSLPKGISPFEKSLSKDLDIQADIRSRVKSAIDTVINDNSNNNNKQKILLEIEFPPLLGGSSTKSQFDDFDNVQELNSNRDWAIQFASLFAAGQYNNGRTWLIFPDLKECELARSEWTGKRYADATYTTLKDSVEFLLNRNQNSNTASASSSTSEKEASSYSAPWGAALAENLNKLLSSSSTDNNNNDDGGTSNDAGLLGDQSSLDPLIDGQNYLPPLLNLVVQPGNGGPVEDWINCETIFTALERDELDRKEKSMFVIVNGALDKVRDGYYPSVFFPNLAKTVNRFYKKFESVFYLKPIVDKGLYGWLYRVYPEPWQVILQIVTTKENGSISVKDKVVFTSDERPSYAAAVSKMMEGAAQ